MSEHAKDVVLVCETLMLGGQLLAGLALVMWVLVIERRRWLRRRRRGGLVVALDNGRPVRGRR